MKRLRHPIRAIREPFGTAGLIVACLALVLAMGGAAVAAKGGLSGKQKKEVAKIARKEAKKFATVGPQGPAGPGGAVGAKGDKGDTGTNGTNGATGSQGPQGPQGQTGEAGVCSEVNPECVFPSEATATGVWVVANPSGSGSSADLSAISFPLRMPSAPTTVVQAAGLPVGQELRDERVVFFGPHEELETEEQVEEDAEAYEVSCPGNVEEPKAAPGFLCIYRGKKNGTGQMQLASSLSETASEFGVAVPWLIGFGVNMRGTWAVTAP